MTQLFDDKELEELRAEIARLMPDRMTVQRPGVSVDAAGYPTETGAVAAYDVPCRLDPIRRDGDIVVGERETMAGQYRLNTQHGTDIRNGDRIVVNGVTFEVLAIDKRVSSGLVLRGIVVELS